MAKITWEIKQEFLILYRILFTIAIKAINLKQMHRSHLDGYGVSVYTGELLRACRAWQSYIIKNKLLGQYNKLLGQYNKHRYVENARKNNE